MGREHFVSYRGKFMLIRTLSAAALLVSGAAAQAMVVTSNFGTYSVSYENATSFGALSFNGSSGGHGVYFGWDVPIDVAVVSGGGAAASASFALPSFTIAANPGYTLVGPITGFMGNLVFSEYGAGAVTGVSVSGDVLLNGSFVGSPIVELLRHPTFSTAMPSTQGVLSGSGSTPVGALQSFSFNNGLVTLTASGGSFASITAQPQNIYRYDFTATPVPEAETYALMGAGLLALGVLARRRQVGRD